MSASGEFNARLERFTACKAMVWRDAEFSFEDLLALRARQKQQFAVSALGSGPVVAVEGGFSPAAVSALLAVLDVGGVAVPVAAGAASKKREFYETAEVEWVLAVAGDDSWTFEPTGRRAGHELIRRLRRAEIGHFHHIGFQILLSYLLFISATIKYGRTHYFRSITGHQGKRNPAIINK